MTARAAANARQADPEPKPAITEAEERAIRDYMERKNFAGLCGYVEIMLSQWFRRGRISGFQEVQGMMRPAPVLTHECMVCGEMIGKKGDTCGKCHTRSCPRCGENLEESAPNAGDFACGGCEYREEPERFDSGAD